MSRRLFWLLAIVVVASTVSVLYVVRRAGDARTAAHTDSGVVADEGQLAAQLQQPRALFRSTRMGQGYGHVVVSGVDPEGRRLQTALECERVDAVPAAGVCLSAERGVLTKYWATTFDAALRPMQRLELAGIPSRVRVSPDGRLAGITVFVSGHGYSNAEFSTSTTLLSVADGVVIADLETFAVTRDGRPFKDADFNFWGVTFTADSNLFYATLGSGNRIYLVKGDASRRTAVVLGEGVECPSLSPDNRRIAYKKRTYDGGRLLWRLAVIELETMREMLIEGEQDSVDDQVEWLDDEHVIYAVADETPGNGGTSIRKVNVHGGPSSLWAAGAYSPSVVATRAVLLP